MAHDSSSFKSQLSDSLSKRHGETSPLCVKSSSWRSEGSPRRTEGSPWRSESSLQRSEPPPIRKENPSLPAESSSVQGKNNKTIMNSLIEEPKKPAKNAVLSRVFSKPPAKDSESTENLVTDKKESRTAKKHKLYSQNLLDETARNSPDINMKQVENVQFSNVKTKTVIKSKPSKEVKTRGKHIDIDFNHFALCIVFIYTVHLNCFVKAPRIYSRNQRARKQQYINPQRNPTNQKLTACRPTNQNLAINLINRPRVVGSARQHWRADLQWILLLCRDLFRKWRRRR